jgi:gliding motility-associated-like protein
MFDWDVDGIGDFDDLEDLSNLFSGWYNLDVIDGNGCTVSDSIFLTAPVTLNVSTFVTTNYNGEDVSCQGSSDGGIGAIVQGGTGGYTYEWVDMSGNIISTNQSVSGLEAGYYYVAVMDQNSCTIYDSIEVEDAPELLVTISIATNYNGQDISCFGMSDGGIDFNVSGGTPGYVYEWRDQFLNILGTSEDLNGIPAGTYTIYVVDLNGCTIDTSITVTEPPALSVTALITTDYNGEDISCFGFSDGGLDANAVGGTPQLTYQWIDSLGNLIGTNSILNGVSEGMYTVLVTDTNGCQSSKEIYVSQPIELGLDLDILTDYYGAAVSCESQEDGAIQAFGCCGTPSYQYSWNTNPVQNTSLISGLGEGTYTVTLTDANGCELESSVTLSANPIPQLNPDPPVEACQGEAVTFNSNADANESCEWLFSNNMVIDNCGPNTIYIDEAGCYDAQLIITNEFGCSNSISLTDYICIFPNPTADFFFTPETLSSLEADVDFYNESIGAVDYLWDFGDGTTATTFDAYHQYEPGQSITYEVILYVNNEFGCVDSISKEIKIKDELLVYVPNTFTPDGGQYNNVFKPVLGSNLSVENYEFSVFNRWGEQIFISNDPNEFWDGTYRGKQCQEGTYVWKLVLIASEEVIESGQRSEYIGHVNLLR